jgi:hypothetical protein
VPGVSEGLTFAGNAIRAYAQEGTGLQRMASFGVNEGTDAALGAAGAGPDQPTEQAADDFKAHAGLVAESFLPGPKDDLIR